MQLKLRYALSDEETFVLHGSNFDYGAFYDSIINRLEDSRYEAETNDLLEWWNELVYVHAGFVVVLTLSRCLVEFSPLRSTLVVTPISPV